MTPGKTYLTSDEIRPLAERSDAMGAWLVLHCWGVIALAVTGFLTLWMVIPLIMVVCGMMALVMPNGIACFLSLFERDSGAATGLNGALQFLLAGIVGTVLGTLHNGTPLPMTLLMVIASVAALALFLLLTPEKHSAPRH